MLPVTQLKIQHDFVATDEVGEKITVKLSAQTVIRSVVTIHEASVCWQKSPRTIRNLCQLGILVAEKSGGTWLITTQSVFNRWGSPLINLGDYRNV